MTWNYRLVVTAEDSSGRDIEVCEVYYNVRGEADGYVNTAPPGGDSVQEALQSYHLMGAAFRKPILRRDDDGKLAEVDKATERSWELEQFEAHRDVPEDRAEDHLQHEQREQ
jgi:hypothetical protein